MSSSPQLSSRSRRAGLIALSVAVAAVFALAAAETESLFVAALFTAAICPASTCGRASPIWSVPETRPAP
jgi:hypothetical protein